VQRSKSDTNTRHWLVDEAVQSSWCLRALFYTKCPVQPSENLRSVYS